MTIKKIRGMESDFVILPNSALNDSLSWSAKGLLAYLCAKPDDWTVSTQQLINHSALSARPTARDGTYAIINELLDKGYMKRSKSTGEGYSKTDYEVCAKPLPSNPDQDKPLVDEPTLQSKELKQSKDSIQTNSVIDQLFEQFWLAGMARVGGKAKTLTRIKAKVKANPKLEIQSFILFLINDVEKRIASGQYGFDRLHPSRYIQDERYNDDIQTNSSPVNNIEDNDTDWAAGVLS